MNIDAEFRQSEDGRWVAEIPQLSGARGYGPTRREAAIGVTIRAFHILAERVHSGELKVEDELAAIVLGGTADSLSDLLIELQRGHSPGPEPVPATQGSGTESFPRVEEEPSAELSAAQEIDSFAAAPLVAPRTLADYHRLRDMLEALIEKVGADESHPLTAFMDRVGTLVEQYESTHLAEIIESKQKR